LSRSGREASRTFPSSLTRSEGKKRQADRTTHSIRTHKEVAPEDRKPDCIPRGKVPYLRSLSIYIRMAIIPVCVSLERSFESLCNEFREQWEKKNFYELTSVIQGLRPWKDLIHTSVGPVTAAHLHTNPDDPPDVTLVSESTGKSASVEHTDFSNQMHAYASHLLHTKM